MASSGAPVLPPMPDFLSADDPFSTAGDMKFHLQNLLDSKEKQLQQAGSLGQRVLAQQMELEERIRQLQELEADKGEDDEIDNEARERYRELAETIVAWDTENAQLSSTFGSSKRFLNGTHSPAVPYADLPREEPERAKASAGTSAAQSRRAKNAAHRADDVEFAFEIGSGLLTEVRRLQSLLGERDKAIQDMKEEKDDLEKTVEALRTALRQQEQNADKFKEENWNLEVTLQEIRTQLGDSQSSVQRLESEHKRLTKALSNARDAADQHKNEGERLQSVVAEMKSKHETDIAQARKHAAGLARDKSDLQQAVDTLKAEVARAGRMLPRFGSPLTPGGADTKDFLTPAGRDDDGDVFGTTGRGSTNRRNLDVSGLFPPDDLGSDFPDSPDPSPLRRPFLSSNHPTNEIEALQQRLAHAQRQINTLKGSLNREKQLRIKLEQAASASADADEAGPDDGEEYADENTAVVENKRVAKRSTTPFKVGGNRGGRGRGRGRGRGGITLIQRLGMASSSPASDFNDDDHAERDMSESPPPPVPPIPINFDQGDEEDEVSQFFGSSGDHEQTDEVEESQDHPSRSRSPSPSPAEPSSNRTSIDGMDPAFANVLRRIPSNGSSYTRSPLRQAVLGRSSKSGVIGRRPRGGVPYREARPPSIVKAPEVLSAELGEVDASPVKSYRNSLLNDAEIPEEDGEYIRVKKVEKVEFGCQTEVVEEEKTVVLPEPPVVVDIPVVPVPPPVEHAEMGTQSDPEPEPIPPPQITTSEMSLQTEPEPVVVPPQKSEMGIQHFTPEPVPVIPTPPVLIDSGVGTDPIPEPVPVGRGLPPLVIGDSSRRSTLTQSDVSRASTSAGETTITRSFLVGRNVEEEEEEDEGEETETGADTEDDYHDARQSIGLSTPSEDFHSIRTVTDNDYSDSEDGAETEDDTESIKASHFSSIRDPSSSSLVRPTTSSSYYPQQIPKEILYESVAVSADLYEPPSPVIIEAPPPPKPEVKEMSIQTDEWKPPTPPPAAPVPVAAPTPAAPPSKPAGLFRVGSSSHQFQFIPPPPPSSNGNTFSVHGPVFTPPSPVPTPKSSVFREPSGTLVRRATSNSERRQSIESLISSTNGGADDPASRSRVPSSSGNALLTSVDKTRPPVMSLPPPPKQPPPPNSMPPPNFIPERKVLASLNGSHHDGPPPRPSSPPPAELIQRATTPLGSILVPPGKYGSTRLHGSSLPPSQANLRQPPSTSSFRSTSVAGMHTQASMPPSHTLSSYSVRERERNQRSTSSLPSENSLASPRSSMSSERHLYQSVNEPSTPNKTADVTPRANNTMMATDPAIIHAITQTMIGEFLYKYTRRTIGKGVGEKRHKRFFWVHPYTKTLYWSSADPGSSNVSESSAKSAYIDGVRSVLDPNPMPPGLHQYSVIVSTPQREMKITAPTKERHDIWLNALKYLLARPSNAGVTSPANNTLLPQPQTPENLEQGRRPPLLSPQSQRSTRSAVAGETWNTTPRGQRSRSQVSIGGSVGKRSGTPAMEYMRWNAPESPYSPDRSFVDVPGQDSDELDFELHEENMSDEGFEGLENVRACCDGRHTVGPSGKVHHHHHHHHQQPNQGTITSRKSTDNQHLDVNPHLQDQARPSSPAWSFRSRTGSAQSHEAGGGIFGWGRGDDGKIRFGSRRSTKSSVPVQD
ncbi:Anucleate primary sterigmata protein A [Psilocybe cubensis]|uniref:PH domain-containing protein n=2 Tax=Psilocybe cubensis TaxID=181762 RepID=A0A8H7XZ74_PSICU|nr:Anucleate primary sterigmata protein A [Psilocybe cubensis]KAH9478703.1 Anucleate primary sterigmata protein A [Psilocybe cubensis]